MLSILRGLLLIFGCVLLAVKFIGWTTLPWPITLTPLIAWVFLSVFALLVLKRGGNPKSVGLTDADALRIKRL